MQAERKYFQQMDVIKTSIKIIQRTSIINNKKTNNPTKPGKRFEQTLCG